MENFEKIFEEFPPVSTQEWEAVIEKDLKGADYNKKLVWRTAEGFQVRPYYRAENLADIPWTGQNPNEFPYVRGNKSEGNEWLIRQDVTVKDVTEANKVALNALSRGANSIGFKLEYDKAYTAIEISTLLNGIDQKAVEINLYNNKYHLPLLEMLSKIPGVKGSLNYDPLTRYLRRGTWFVTENTDMELAYIMVKAEMPEFQTIGVNGHVFTNAGATIVQEMAFSLAVGAEYLDKLTEKKLTIDEIAPKMRFNLAIGQNYFMELAKLRAYRLLWANIVKVYGGKEENAKMHIHATNAELGMSLYDAYVNMLRTTTGTMSAVLGGVDSFAVMPFDTPFEVPTDFADRIARNQQLILKEEAHFDKVADPAAGSYYIENLTESLAAAAWELFNKIQDEGGYLEAVRKGMIQGLIKESAAKKFSNVATRRETILGTNQFPNFTETMKLNPQPWVFEADDRRDENAEIETIVTFRAAQQFEKLRFATDVYAQDHKRPTAWMFTYGNLAMRKARANFASNFFACAGFEVVDNPGFKTLDEGITTAREVKPEILVICSSDEEYGEGNALKIYEELKNDTIVVLAGNPEGTADILKEAGLKYFIHVKSNVLETLQEFQHQLGITK
ncbi:MAG: methylmalonyl-CoA mutase small subunit [Bacteroidales bacterium]|nr:methylmalonyl-CoA mutase small subunit [Bacteroidales bacterium]